MTDTPLISTIPPSAARRALEMIGQEQALADLEQALATDDGSFKVVLVRAEGGMGKTRLLEEVQKRYGPDADHPSPANGPLVARLIDVIDTRLHDRYRFVTEMRESLKQYPALDFSAFDAADDRVKLLLSSGAQLDSIDKAQREASDIFVQDLARAAEHQRIVFLVDTVERLSYKASEWLLKKKFLRSEDLEIRTHHWLQRFIAESKLHNITLVLAGRGREGADFYDRVGRTARRHGRGPIDIPLKRLSINQTREYFVQLAEDWQAESPAVAGNYAEAANPDLDRFKVIGLYTHGVPVRLALYAQVLAESRAIPAAFRLSFAEACRRANLAPASIDLDAEPPEKTTPELQQIQWQVEEEFLNLLFHDPDDRRSLVLRTLVRAPRGLTAEQIHFALDAPEGADPAAWQKEVRNKTGDHAAKLEWLVDLLKLISRTEYLAKARSSLGDFEAVLDEGLPETATFRVGLQDEMYRIYAEHTGLLAHPISPETAAIRRGLSDAERKRYEQNRTDEQDQRQQLYVNLANFADYRYRRLLDAKRNYLRDDEIAFEQRFRIDDPNTFRFTDPPSEQIEERRMLHAALSFFEIERMVYRLLLDPELNLNLEYITLEDDNARAARQEEDFWAQAEMWRVVHDDWLMKFIDLHNRKAAEARGETAVDVLRRFAEQENVARWIKRLVLRSSAERVIGVEDREIAFAEQVEEYIRSRPRGGGPGKKARQQYNDWGSWNHTLASAERIIWTQVAYIRRGRNVAEATNEIGRQIVKLEKLYTTDVNTLAIDNDGYPENGFAAAGDDAPAHPAHARLRRLLSHAYNHLGYGRRTQGRMHDAVVYYGRALNYVREEKGKMKAHRASVLNNLSRALSELGWNGLGVCLDGRDLRWELAEEVPLASSYNTLALIYDDMGRYEDAPLLSAKAIAYCRRAVESRQLGLSLRQMAESLRHIAERGRTGQRALALDTYYNAAEGLLREARSIFESLKQAERSIEVNLELGSLYRDRLRERPDETWTQLRRRAREKAYVDALSVLKTAERLAVQHGVAQHALDVRINLARVHFYADEIDEATRILDDIDAVGDYQNHIIKPGYLPDSARDELRDRNWTFRHLGTAQRVRGHVALDRFGQRVEYYRKQHPEEDPETRRKRQELVKNDEAAKAALLAAAEAYALSIAYAELYSPRSRSIGAIQNDLYGRLRASNRGELESFRACLEQVGEKYERALSSVPLLLRFMNEFFGLEPDANPDQPAQQTSEGHYD